MSIAAISPSTALWLTRIRWLAWGAVAALLAVHLALAAASPPAPAPAALQLDHVAAHAGGTCGCSHNSETI